MNNKKKRSLKRQLGSTFSFERLELRQMLAGNLATYDFLPAQPLNSQICTECFSVKNETLSNSSNDDTPQPSSADSANITNAKESKEANSDCKSPEKGNEDVAKASCEPGKGLSTFGLTSSANWFATFDSNKFLNVTHSDANTGTLDDKVSGTATNHFEQATAIESTNLNQPQTLDNILEPEHIAVLEKNSLATMSLMSDSSSRKFAPSISIENLNPPDRFDYFSEVPDQNSCPLRTQSHLHQGKHVGLLAHSQFFSLAGTQPSQLVVSTSTLELSSLSSMVDYEVRSNILPNSAKHQTPGDFERGYRTDLVWKKWIAGVREVKRSTVDSLKPVEDISEAVLLDENSQVVRLERDEEKSFLEQARMAPVVESTVFFAVLTGYKLCEETIVRLRQRPSDRSKQNSLQYRRRR